MIFLQRFIAEAAAKSFIIEKYSQCSTGAISQGSYIKKTPFTADKMNGELRLKCFS